jgi:hypothetical protein
MQVLRAIRAVDQRGIFVFPWIRRFCGEPTIFPGGVLAIGNAFKSEDSAVEKAADLAYCVLATADCGVEQFPGSR